MSSVDYYDVQKMISDERVKILASVRDDIRDLRNMIDELRDDLASLKRTLDARTEHLA